MGAQQKTTIGYSDCDNIFTKGEMTILKVHPFTNLKHPNGKWDYMSKTEVEQLTIQWTTLFFNCKICCQGLATCVWHTLLSPYM